MSETTYPMDSKKIEVIDQLLTELAAEIHEEKLELLNRLICKYISYEDVEDFYDLFAGEYALARFNASDEEPIDFLSL